MKRETAPTTAEESHNNEANSTQPRAVAWSALAMACTRTQEDHRPVQVVEARGFTTYREKLPWYRYDGVRNNNRKDS